MRFEVSVAVPVKIAILRGVTQCSLVGNSFRETCCLFLQGLPYTIVSCLR